MAERARWAFCVTAGAALALAVAGCSRPAHQIGANADTAAAAEHARPAGSEVLAMADPSDSIDSDFDSDSADAGAPQAPPILSARRDERTLRQDHPYRARHGVADCESECTVHEAGYKWAALHSLRDARLCVGRERGFVVGCRAYVEDHSG